MAISIYTRAPKETGLNLNIDKELERSDMLSQQREQQARQDKKESEATYLKWAKVDPVYNASTYWQKDMGDKIKEYKDYLAKKYHGAKIRNRPDLEDQIDIQNHQAALFGYIQNVKANQKKYEQFEKEIQNDPYGVKYDRNYYKTKIKKWYDTGDLDDDALQAPKVDLAGQLSQQNWLGLTKETITDPRTGKPATVNRVSTEDELKNQLRGFLFDAKNPGRVRTLTEEFHELPRETQQQYYNKYPNGGNDDQGPITDYFFDKYGHGATKHNIMGKNPAKDKAPVSSPISGSLELNAPTEQFTISRDTPSGNKTNYKINKYGSIKIKGATAGVLSARKYWSMNDGELKKAQAGIDIPLKNIEITAVPVGDDDRMSVGNYTNKDGSLKPGYRMQVVLVTKPGDAVSKAVVFDDEVKQQLITQFPKLKNEIENIPTEVELKAQKQEAKSEAKKETSYDPKKFKVGTAKNGKKYLVDIKTNKVISEYNEQ